MQSASTILLFFENKVVDLKYESSYNKVAPCGPA